MAGDGVVWRSQASLNETEVLYSTVCKSLVILEATSWYSKNKEFNFQAPVLWHG